jgi:hypothetical protein
VLLNSYQGSRSIFIKVNFSAMEQPKLTKLSIHKFLVVVWGHSRLDTYEFQCTIESS